jgi:hypothetical protein
MWAVFQGFLSHPGALVPCISDASGSLHRSPGACVDQNSFGAGRTPASAILLSARAHSVLAKG